MRPKVAGRERSRDMSRIVMIMADVKASRV
jgi:hypothetical protein